MKLDSSKHDDFLVVSAPNPPLLQDAMNAIESDYVLVAVFANPQNSAATLVAVFAKPGRVKS